MREVIDATNVLAGKTRRALDSTVLDDAVTRQDAIMQLVAQIRRVRRLIPAAKALELVAHDYDNDPGKPACAWNDRADIDRVVTELVNDAHTILAALDGVELDDAQAEAVGLLALVAGQDVEPGDSDGTWRIAPVTRPDRIVSVHDPESRHVHKTNHELPRRVQSPHRGRARHRADHRLRADRRQRRRRPGRARAARRRDRHRSRCSPTPPTAPASSATTSPNTATPRRSNRSRCTPPIADGFTIDDFTIDLDRDDRHLPERDHRHDQPPITPGPLRADAATAARCGNAAPARRHGKILTVHEHHDLLAAARAHALTADVHRALPPAPTDGRTLHRLARRRGGRKVRYRGIARNRIGLAHRCAAINLRRLINLGLTLGQPTGSSPPEPAGPGLTRRERHLRRSAIQRGRLTPSNIGSSVGHVPGPTNNATTTHPPNRKSHCSAVS